MQSSASSRRTTSRVDACVVLDGWMKTRNTPEFVVATRGLVALDVEVRTGERDLHSGHYGGTALNAIHALVAGADSALRARWPAAGAAARGRHASERRRGRRVARAAARRGRARPRRRGAARRPRRRGVLRARLRRAVARRDGDPRRQARPAEHDARLARGGRHHDPRRARTGSRSARRRGRGAAA